VNGHGLPWYTSIVQPPLGTFCQITAAPVWAVKGLHIPGVTPGGGPPALAFALAFGFDLALAFGLAFGFGFALALGLALAFGFAFTFDLPFFFAILLRSLLYAAHFYLAPLGALPGER
jgi:hypothetical protein